jgi:fimbrial chaperone protein
MLRHRLVILWLICSAAVSSAHAAALQISPVMVYLQFNENASTMTLHNSGNEPLYGQVRIFQWDQANGDDLLTPTQDMIASPPLLQIAAQTDQLIRLVRTAPSSSVTVEQSFRLLIDEIPPPDESLMSGVNIRLRYSVPLFVEPAGAVAQPNLSWHLAHDGNKWILRVDNSGKRHAQIAAVALIASPDKTYEITKGLLGYALTGRGREWQVNLPADADLRGTVKVRASVNSAPVEAVVEVEGAK